MVVAEELAASREDLHTRTDVDDNDNRILVVELKKVNEHWKICLIDSCKVSVKSAWSTCGLSSLVSKLHMRIEVHFRGAV